jgi:hypothetical protein
MRPEVFGEFLLRQGHRIIKTDNCYWYNAQSGFFFYFPYHRLIKPNKEEFTQLFFKEHCIGVRFFTPMEGFGKESYLIVCSDKKYDITSVNADYARRQTRRGLERFEIRQLDFHSLALQGIQANYDTLIRQGRNPNIWNENRWRHYCSAAEGLDGFEAWGAFQENQLAAFIIAFQMEDHFTILHHSSVSEYLSQYPNNALVFYLTRLKLRLPEVNCVFYGPESLDAPPSLDEFKFRMGFAKRPMKQSIVFNPIFKPLVNGISHKLVRLISSSRPESDNWRKLLGIIQFYRASH